MKSFISLVLAIEYIEARLREPLTVGDVARASYTSPSHLQGMFSRTFHISIGQYIVKRKLCAAAWDLTQTGKSVTDIAYDCGYANVESFSRAFKKTFRHAPSAYRREYRFSQLYPRLIIHEKEGVNMDQKYDLTEISEKIIASKGTYIICADMDHLMKLNKELGHAAGDAAIAEAAARIGKCVQGGMDFYRIGGDSFVILTGSEDLAVAEAIARDIIALADREVEWTGGAFTFSISMGIAKIPVDSAEARVAIEQSDAAMYAAKKEGGNCYTIL